MDGTLVVKAWNCTEALPCQPLDSDREIALKFLERYDLTIKTTNQRLQLVPKPTPIGW